MSDPLCMIGDAVFERIGPNPSSFKCVQQATLAEHQVFDDAPFYQPTAMGSRKVTVELATRAHIFGGLENVAILRAHQEALEIVPFNIAAAWHDEKTGRRRLSKVPTGRDGPIVILPHPYRSEIEAREAAKSQAYERGNNSGSGHFESPGLPRARAKAPVIASGFGGFIDGRWKAESVEKVITVQGGFTTTVNITAGDEKKGQKGK